jgi:transposase-like protein
MQRPPHCPNCDQAWPDEYTFYDCPVATGVGDHRHWVCPSCGYDWVESLSKTAS